MRLGPAAQVVLLILMLVASVADAATDADQLRALHEKVMRAHRQSDVELLLEDEAADYVVAGRGEVTRPTIDQRRARLGAYLQSTRFSEYRDLVEPVVTVSADGTLGWVVVQVHARGVQATPEGRQELLEFVSAWIELYQKRDGRWLRVGNVSNFREAPLAGLWTEPRTGMTFVQVPAGRFVMGSPASEPHRQDQEVPHDVTITSPFLLGQFEVTQEQWRAVMGTTPSVFQGDPTRPVENVSWLDVQEFLRRLTATSSDSRFRLPTEAEWEYACRAGAATTYHVGESLDARHARIDPRRPDDPEGLPATGGPVPVGSFAPNAWGLHDMHGNVWEWTADAHCSYSSDPSIDPRPACDGPLKVIRGGSWYFRADSARCAARYTHRPQDRGFSLGFRVVREVGPR